jgi:hypothetical protein
MRTNRTFAVNCAVTLASARINFGKTYKMNKLCGFTRRGLVGVALATTYYIPLMLNLDVGLSAKLDRKNAIGPLPGSFPVAKSTSAFKSIGWCTIPGAWRRPEPALLEQIEVMARPI